MKIVYVSDLHTNLKNYDELLIVVKKNKPDLLIIGGDIFPRGKVSDHINFAENYLYNYFSKVKEIVPEAMIFFILGNDDWKDAEKSFAGIEEKGLAYYCNCKKVSLKNRFEIIGYSYVPPSPFKKKDFEKLDLKEDAIPLNPSEIYISRGGEVVVTNPSSHFSSVGTIEEDLNLLPLPLDFSRSIYILHSPPFNTALDKVMNGLSVGSRSIRAFIEKKQPLLTLHGHIHESYSVTKRFYEKIGKTVSINAGQINLKVDAVIFDTEDIEGTIVHTNPL